MENYHDMPIQKYWSFAKSFKGDKAAATKGMVFSGDYIGARKMDGAFAKFWKDENGNMELLGRNKSVSGDYLNKLDHVPQLHEFFEGIPNGTCLIGEIYFPNNEGSSNVTSIMGCLLPKALSRQETGDKLHYYIFDILAWDGVDYYTKPIEQRVGTWKSKWEERDLGKYVEIAKYYKGEKLWQKLQTVLAVGGEGVVITKLGTPYHPGKRPARQTLKIKKELQETLDVVIMGAIEPKRLYNGSHIENWQYWENLISKKKTKGNYYEEYLKNGKIEPVSKNYFNEWAGSLIIGLYEDGLLVKVGQLGGLTESILKDANSYIGKVAEVSGMEIFKDTNGIRHPKFLQWREDKPKEDCTIDQIR